MRWGLGFKDNQEGFEISEEVAERDRLSEDRQGKEDRPSVSECGGVLGMDGAAERSWPSCVSEMWRLENESEMLIGKMLSIGG